ncbi:Hypothetical protein SMAX5B_021188 [Scophthalmus maximus]|uniref:Uncharacterized protein n=1 Tax=Scophthalmus maximus TaxID=52904 RepID=A0A2U9BLR5_SCOMX|nr:Hypothetical protein SMAX5B_021188 [Scophthalmus maximus]KAF0036925.1 hypothetical protein F2P81_009799 [Scophthalmus maximus]
MFHSASTRLLCEPCGVTEKLVPPGDTVTATQRFRLMFPGFSVDLTGTNYRLKSSRGKRYDVEIGNFR